MVVTGSAVLRRFQNRTARDYNLIEAHWDDILRLATSIRTGAVSASLMLLGSYPRQNGLALALREIGRIERTMFTLDWLDNPILRRQATAELNKGESKNALSRASASIAWVASEIGASKARNTGQVA